MTTVGDGTKVTAAVPLNDADLPQLNPEIPRPTYDRTSVRTGIVHVGVGGFHRAHQAMYVDRLMNDGKALEWGICGVGIMPADRRMKDALDAQDGLYTLVVKHADGTLEPRVIGSIVDYLFAPDDPEAVVERMADPQTRIVSLTITEGGYNLDPDSGAFDESNPQVQKDLETGAAPRTSFGLVTEALARRRERQIPPFTVLSCDNLQANGDIAQRSFVAFASLRDPDLGAWVQAQVQFPNCMVDRITPATTAEDTAEIASRFGIEDQWPVVCEPFTQWVLDDAFGAGRPPLEDVGVQIVHDVAPYELMKLRLLNASHQALCYFGYLAGYRFVHDVCTDPLFVDFLLAYMEQEATPSLSPVPGIDLDDYRHTLIARFSNTHVRDTVGRLCAESSDRIPKWLLPVVRHNLETGGEIRRSAAVVASWARYAEGTDEQGQPIEIVDRLKDVLVPLAQQQRADPLAFLRHPMFGDLGSDARFSESYLEALASLHSVGARMTLEGLI